MKTVIIYHSVTGHTKTIAELLKKEFGSDICDIYNAPSIDSYAYVLLGSPIRDNTVPEEVLSYLDQNDWSGKTVIPFFTCGGSPRYALSDLKKHTPGARVTDDAFFRFTLEGELLTFEDSVERWCTMLRRKYGF